MLSARSAALGKTDSHGASQVTLRRAVRRGRAASLPTSARVADRPTTKPDANTKAANDATGHANFRYVRRYSELGIADIPTVGGKNASMGEMISTLKAKGVRVPDGCATTAEAFKLFLAVGGLDTKIYSLLDKLNVEDTKALRRCGERIRGWILDAVLPDDFQEEIKAAYKEMCDDEVAKLKAAGLPVDADHQVTVAIRSSATAEDLPDASFAGQQETYLNVQGETDVLRYVRRVMASLFTDRAISYRVHNKFAHKDVALSVGIQKMVRSDIACSGVVFSLDTESGFRDAVLITGAYGLGETVVQGTVNPDEWLVFKPVLLADAANPSAPPRVPIVRRHLGEKAIKMVHSVDRITGDTTMVVPTSAGERSSFCLTDAEVIELSKFACTIEQHYSEKAKTWRPMDIEWAKDGVTGELFIVQSRPETVKSSQFRRSGAVVEVCVLAPGQVKTPLVTGRSVGARIGTGAVRVIMEAKDMNTLKDGEILVTDITDPDWEPVMRRASAIVTNRGGRTCHAAIVAREIGIPAIVGCSVATQLLTTGTPVTVVCSEGDTGSVYAGKLEFTRTEVDTSKLERPKRTKLTLIMSNPELAFGLSSMPVSGVGLARLEFVIARFGIHPQACLAYPSLAANDELRPKLAAAAAAAGVATPAEAYVQSIAHAVATIGAAFYPNPVIVRMSDFKTVEYRNLLGGDRYEPEEENPMLGFRGASRYYSPSFEASFGLECAAMKLAREKMGLTNIELMIPFTRTVKELDLVLATMAKHGLKRGDGAAAEAPAVTASSNGPHPGLKIHIMCEIPANVIQADAFLERCDGFSIGSNDLTQLTLGVDRDSGTLKGFDERDPAVTSLMASAIASCRKAGKYIGICGQGPSDFPELAEFLVKHGIHSISLNSDSVLGILPTVVAAEHAGPAWSEAEASPEE